MAMDPAILKLFFTAGANFSSLRERRLFLDKACGDDAELRRELDELLEGVPDAEAFFEFPPEVHATDQGAKPSATEEGLGATIGRYRLIERIGAGGCGVVYLAEQREPVRRKVALKIVRLGMDTENVIARFAAERQALALMDHPNIARVLDAGATASGRPYFVMELVDGERITDFCESAKLDLRPRLQLFVKVCQAIQHAHQKGVIHRDIKPSNVLVWQNDALAEPKVIDFGIAKATAGGAGEEATFTAFDQFLGTPAYMSPEQAAGGMDVDTRSDIYSLGALLYELIAGSPPFDAKRLTQSGLEETRRILREEEPPAPSPLAGHAKVRDLDWIVMKAMAKERQRRYDTANGLALDVIRFLGDEPVSARPPSRGYRLGKLVRRNKLVFATGSLALLMLVAGLGVSIRLFFREKATGEEQARLHRIAQRARLTEIALREAAESREQVAKAAVQLSRGNTEEAERLLAGVPLEGSPVSLEAADCYHRIALWHVFAGRWTPAGERFSSAIHAQANVDDSDSDNISRNLLPASTALCYAGDLAGYERFREFAIRRFAGTSHPLVAEQVVKATLLRPIAAPAFRELDALALLVEKTLEDPNSFVARDDYLAAWCYLALGLKCYRQDDLELATRWLNRCLSSPQANAPRTASARSLLAMIEQRSGRPENARAFLELARGPVEEVMDKPLEQGGTPKGFWFDWINAKLFLSEAEGLIGGGESAAIEALEKK